MLAGCGASAPEGKTLGLAVSDPYDFVEMRSAAPGSSTITGLLVLPQDRAPRAAAILSHGAAGPGGRQYRMARHLAAQGIAALLLDHFEGRNVGSVVADQLRVPEQTMLSDIRIARDALAERLDLPPGRIGAMGWSKGATTVTLGAVDRLWGYLGDDPAPLGFAVAFYPFCGFDLGEERLASPLLMLLGGADDWTPAGPCIDNGQAWREAGEPVDWRLFEGAPHGFDSGLDRAFRIDRAITVRDTTPGCTLTVEEGGRTVTLDRAHAFEGVPGRRAFLERCGVRGVTFGGDDAAAAKAYRAIDAFLAERLP